MAPHGHWKNTISAVLSIMYLSIKSGYNLDPYCVHLAKNNISGTHLVNGLWYIGGHLVIPQIGDLQENLYCLVHDLLGHFRADKSYASLHDNYYWPNMCTDLEKSYIPLCDACQQNKSQTTKPPGPLHPLPILDECGDSVTLPDFIGPLSANKGYNCILSMTDRLGSNVWIISTWTDATAEDIVLLVFNNWYHENGLLLNWVSDRDKPFMSCLWKVLAKLTGVKLKMSSVYHPQTDGTSEQTNKRINQSIHFHVQCNQKGWVWALPHIWHNECHQCFYRVLWLSPMSWMLTLSYSPNNPYYLACWTILHWVISRSCHIKNTKQCCWH